MDFEEQSDPRFLSQKQRLLALLLYIVLLFAICLAVTGKKWSKGCQALVIGIFSSGPSQSFAQFVYLLLESWFLSPIMDSVIQVVSSPLRTPRNAPEGQVLQCNTHLL
jgi:hypothetical protein